MKRILCALSTLLISLESGLAAKESMSSTGEKTTTVTIPADLPLPPSAEKVAPTHPFFSATSTGNEVMEKIQELEERIEKLEKKVNSSEKVKTE